MTRAELEQVVSAVREEIRPLQQDVAVLTKQVELLGKDLERRVACVEVDVKAVRVTVDDNSRKVSQYIGYLTALVVGAGFVISIVRMVGCS